MDAGFKAALLAMADSEMATGAQQSNGKATVENFVSVVEGNLDMLLDKPLTVHGQRARELPCRRTGKEVGGGKDRDREGWPCLI